MKLPTKPLGEICEIKMGQSPPSSTYNTLREGLPFFQGKTDFGDIYPTANVWCSKPVRIAEKGAILISVRAPVGPTNVAKEICCIGRGLASIRPLKETNTEYVLYALRYLEPNITAKGSGSTFQAINRKQLSEFEIPFPSLSEQKRIASVLSRADELRQKRRQADELSGRFLQSLFVKTFGDPAENSKEWEMRRLGDIATFVNGRAFKPSEWTENGMPIIRIQNLNNPEADHNYFDGDYDECHLVKQGDLLISWSATLDVFKWDKPPALLNQHIFKVVFDKCEISLDYFSYAVKNELEFMRNKAHGSTMKHITKKPFENTQIAFPPLSLQKKFAARVAEFEKFRKKQVEAGQKVELLFKSLMDRYFGG